MFLVTEMSVRVFLYPGDRTNCPLLRYGLVRCRNVEV